MPAGAGYRGAVSREPTPGAGRGLSGPAVRLIGRRRCRPHREYSTDGLDGEPRLAVHWVQRGAVADDADTARNLALAADWQVDAIALAGNLLFWAYAGMLVVVGLVLVRRARPAHDADRGPVGDRP